jgi:hypothetical protein
MLFDGANSKSLVNRFYLISSTSVTFETDDHESHGDAFREELTSRDVEVNDLLLNSEGIKLTVDYEHPDHSRGSRR